MFNKKQIRFKEFSLDSSDLSHEFIVNGKPQMYGIQEVAIKKPGINCEIYESGPNDFGKFLINYSRLKSPPLMDLNHFCATHTIISSHLREYGEGYHGIVVQYVATKYDLEEEKEILKEFQIKKAKMISEQQKYFDEYEAFKKQKVPN